MKVIEPESVDETKGFNERLNLLKAAFLRSSTHKHLLNFNLVFVFLCRKLKEDKEEIEEQRRLRQEEEERSLVTVSFFKKCVLNNKKRLSKLYVKRKRPVV